MLRRFSEIRNMRLTTKRGTVGKITDLVLDDDRWNVRYLLIGKGDRRRVRLISPASVNQIDFQAGEIRTCHTAKQIVSSPDFDFREEILRKDELILVNHFGWPIYWLGRTDDPNHGGFKSIENVVSNLRSANDVCGYRIDSEDGFVGYLMDLVIDLDAWRVEYATADPESWISEESATLSTKWIDRVNWNRGRIQVDLQKAKTQRRTGRQRPLDETDPPVHSTKTYWMGD